MTGYYDIVLGLIPVTLVGIAGGLVLAGVSFTAAVPAGALVSAGLIGHAMFVRSPLESTPMELGEPGGSGRSETESPTPHLAAD